MRIEQNLGPLLRDLERVVGKAGNAGSEALRASLDDEGSGWKYHGLPYRSSAPGEYPSYQTGETLESVGYEVDGPTAHIGGIHDPPEQVTWLHVKPEGDGGRPFALYAMFDREHRQAIEDALEEAGR